MQSFVKKKDCLLLLNDFSLLIFTTVILISTFQPPLIFLSLVSSSIFSPVFFLLPSPILISLSLSLTHTQLQTNQYGNTLCVSWKLFSDWFFSPVYIFLALPHFTSTLGDAQMSEWQKVKMKGKVRSSSASSSWHCITSHSIASVLWFPSVFSEAPQQQGGAFFRPFPSTFAWHSLLGFSLKHSAPHKLTQRKRMVSQSQKLEYYIFSVLSAFTDSDQGELVTWENTCRNFFVYISWLRIQNFNRINVKRYPNSLIIPTTTTLSRWPLQRLHVNVTVFKPSWNPIQHSCNV